MLEVPEPGGLPGRVLTGTQAKKEKWVAGGKAGAGRRSEEPLTADPELQGLESAMSPSCFGSAVLGNAQSSLGIATYEHICAVPLYVGPMSFAFLLYRELQLRDCLESQERL